MAVEWPLGVNAKAYGMTTGYMDNTETVEMKSGRRVVYLKNSSPRKAFSFKIRMKDNGPGSEYRLFLSWWDNTVKSGAENFLFTNLVTHSGQMEYQFTEPPRATGQKYKEVTISVMEI